MDNVFKTPRVPNGVEDLDEMDLGAEGGHEGETSPNNNVLTRRTVNMLGETLRMTVSSSSEYLNNIGVVKCKTESIGGETISIRANVIDELENNYITKRTKVVREDGFLNSPLHVLKSLADEFKAIFHSEVYLINSKFGAKLWRVEVLVGEIRGVGQAPVRPLAFQMAAADALGKLYLTNKVEVPIYGLWIGCRIAPTVYRELNQICQQNDLSLPTYTVTESKAKFEDEPLFEVTCSIGRLTASVKSDNRHMAKRLAAKDMIEKLTGECYPDMEVAVGNNCIGLNELRGLGIHPLSSSKKKQWLETNRTTEGKLFSPEDEPDDFDEGDLEDVEDAFDNLTIGKADFPKKGEMTGLTRVVMNNDSTTFSEDSSASSAAYSIFK